MFSMTCHGFMEKLKIQMIDRVTLAAVLVLFTTQFVFPSVTFASIANVVNRYANNFVTLPYEFNPALGELVKIADSPANLLPVFEQELNEIAAVEHYGNLPKTEYKEPAAIWNAIATAYSSDFRQTDSTPCITANMFNICEAPEPQQNIIANNCLRFGTRVSLPDIFGDRIFIVKDRLNSRYGCERVDIWMHGQEQAKFFGVKYGKMHIYDDGAEIKHRSELSLK